MKKKTTGYMPYSPHMTFLEKYSGYKDQEELTKEILETYRVNVEKSQYAPYYKWKEPSQYGQPRNDYKRRRNEDTTNT